MLFEQEVACGLLQDYAAGAEAHGAHYVAIVFGGGEDDYAGAQCVKIHFFEHAEAVFFGHAQIEEKNIRLELRQHLDAFDAVAGFADDLHVVGAFEQLAEAVAEDSVVVRDEDASYRSGFRHCRFNIAGCMGRFNMVGSNTVNSRGYRSSDAPRAQDSIQP
jgi:hypothetical protein